MSFVVKKCADKNDHFRFAIHWSQNRFVLTVLKGADAYQKEISSGYLQEQAELLRQDFDQYYKNLKQYTEEDNKNVVFKFDSTNRNFEMHYFIGSGSVRYFYIELPKIEYCDCVENVIDSLNENTSELFAQLNVMKSENGTLKNDLSQYKNRLEEFVKAKKMSDKQMLSNFVILLNEKKSRIQYLTELLEAFKSGREPNNPPIKKPTKRSKTIENSANKIEKKPKMEVISESDSENSDIPMEEDYNSEEEKINRAVDLAIPSTSKADPIFLQEDSPPREIRIRPMKNKAEKKDVIIKSLNLMESSEQTNKQPENIDSEKISSALDFNTQDLLDEL